VYNGEVAPRSFAGDLLYIESAIDGLQAKRFDPEGTVLPGLGVQTTEDEDEFAITDLIMWLNSTFPLGFTKEELQGHDKNIDTKTMTAKNIDAHADAVIDAIKHTQKNIHARCSFHG